MLFCYRFYQDQNPKQDLDQDFTLKFNNRNAFNILKKLANLGFDLQTHSKGPQ